MLNVFMKLGACHLCFLKGPPCRSAEAKDESSIQNGIPAWLTSPEMIEVVLRVVHTELRHEMLANAEEGLPPVEHRAHICGGPCA